jgi:ABC-2 type transport system ATP-binding protein
VPEALGPFAPALSADGLSLTYGYDSRAAAGDAGEGEGRGVVDFLRRAVEAGLPFNDLRTKESSLEEIFVSLVAEARR